MNVWIYGLVDPRDGRVRYVGQSVNPETRLVGHQSDRTNQRKVAWLAELRTFEARPSLRRLQRCLSAASASRAERRWIDRLREEGHDLVNIGRPHKPFPRRDPSRALGFRVTQAERRFLEAAHARRLSELGSGHRFRFGDFLRWSILGYTRRVLGISLDEFEDQRKKGLEEISRRARAR